MSFPPEFLIVKQILEYLGLLVQKPSRDPPDQNFSPENNELTYSPREIQRSWNSKAIISQGESFYDDCNGYENPCIMAN